MVMKNERGLKILFYSSLCFGGTPERPPADNERVRRRKRRKEFCFSVNTSLYSHPNLWIATLFFKEREIGLSATGSNWVHVYVLGKKRNLSDSLIDS